MDTSALSRHIIGTEDDFGFHQSTLWEEKELMEYNAIFHKWIRQSISPKATTRLFLQVIFMFYLCLFYVKDKGKKTSFFQKYTAF